MKMARASKADLDAALDVSNIIEQLENGYMPSTDESDELERFDSDDREQCSVRSPRSSMRPRKVRCSVSRSA